MRFQSLATRYSGDVWGRTNFLSSVNYLLHLPINPGVGPSSDDFDEVERVVMAWRKT